MVKDDALEVIEAIYGIEYCGDTELEVLLHHVASGGRSPYTFSQIVQELRNRKVRDLAVATSKCIAMLITAIDRSYAVLAQKPEQGVASMSIDHAAFAHALISAHALNARRWAEELKGHTVVRKRYASLPRDVEHVK